MRRATGQTLLEALALTLALSVALLVPLQADRPIAAVLLAAITDYLRAQAFLLSIL